MNAESEHQSYGWLLLIVAAVVIFLGAARLGMLKLKKLNYIATRGQMTCVNNEKQLGIAFRGFGIDIGGFPMLLSNTNSTVNAPELVDARPTHFGKP